MSSSSFSLTVREKKDGYVHTHVTLYSCRVITPSRCSLTPRRLTLTLLTPCCHWLPRSLCLFSVRLKSSIPGVKTLPILIRWDEMKGQRKLLGFSPGSQQESTAVWICILKLCSSSSAPLLVLQADGELCSAIFLSCIHTIWPHEDRHLTITLVCGSSSNCCHSLESTIVLNVFTCCSLTVSFQWNSNLFQHDHAPVHKVSAMKT